jgi:hypothetical protein
LRWLRKAKVRDYIIVKSVTGSTLSRVSVSLGGYKASYSLQNNRRKTKLRLSLSAELGPLIMLCLKQKRQPTQAAYAN